MQLVFATAIVSERVIYALSWTLLHSIWQGAILALLAGLSMLCMRSKNANLCYNLLSTMLLFFVLSVGFTFYSQWNQPIHLDSRVVFLPNELSPATQITSNEHFFTTPSPQYRLDAVLSFLARIFDQNKFWLLLLWAGIFLLKSVKMALDIAHIYTLRNRRVYPLPLHWQARLQDLAARMGLRQQVQCLESVLVSGPATLGFFKPLILLPFGLINQLSPAQVEAIFLHELAHIQRRDYLVNFLQCFLENLFFFNPGLLWISQRIRRERENCCDDLAIQVLNDKPLYVNALLGFQAYKMQKLQYMQTFWGQKMHLLDRVKRILKRSDYQTLNVVEKISLLFGTLLMGALMLWTAPEIPLKTPVSESIASVFKPKQVTKRQLSDQNIPLTKGEREPEKVEPLIIQPYGKTTALEKTDFVSEPYSNIVDTIPPDLAQLAQLQMDLALAKNQYEQEQAKFDSLKAQAEKKATELGEKIYRELEGERVKNHDKVSEMLLADFIADGIIKDKKQLRSYRLNNNTFKVNGRRQADELRRTYRQKYILNPATGTGNITGLIMLDRAAIVQQDGSIKPLPKWTKAPNQ